MMTEQKERECFSPVLTYVFQTAQHSSSDNARLVFNSHIPAKLCIQKWPNYGFCHTFGSAHEMCDEMVRRISGRK